MELRTAGPKAGGEQLPETDDGQGWRGEGEEGCGWVGGSGAGWRWGLSSGQLGSNPRMLESLVESGFHFRKACELLVGGKWTVGAA